MAQRRDMRHFRPREPRWPRKCWSGCCWRRTPGRAWVSCSRGAFIRITAAALREQLHACVERERVDTARALGEREEEFMKLKVEGLPRSGGADLAVCLADGRERHVFGRRTMPYMDIASVGCALQNTAAGGTGRRVGRGLGLVRSSRRSWRSCCNCPPGASPAGTCLPRAGAGFYDAPMLQQQRWASRMPLADVVFDRTAWGPACRRKVRAFSPPGQSPMADNAGCDSSD